MGGAPLRSHFVLVIPVAASDAVRRDIVNAFRHIVALMAHLRLQGMPPSDTCGIDVAECGTMTTAG